MIEKSKIMNKDLLLLQDNGNFFIYSKRYKSRFFGLFVPFKDYYIKILDYIENLDINSEIKQIDLIDSNFGIINYNNGNYEKYILKDNCLYYETNNISTINLYFDIKHIYDTSEWNRIYSYNSDNQKIILNFKKDDIDVNIIIKGYIEFSFINKWIKIEYNYDKIRNSPPFERYIYLPFQFKAKKLLISMQDKKIEDFENYSNNINNISAYQILKNRLLSFKHKWVSAGYPWYYQEWTRDILISLKGFYLIGEKDFVKNKLIEYSNFFLSNGKMKNINNDFNGNSDSIGWYGKRLFELKNLFDDQTFNKLVNILKENVIKYYDNFFDNKKGLFFSYPNESWMDTLNRKYPIELQFLFLELYENLYNYLKDNFFKEKYDELKENIRKNYIEDYSLIDDIENRSIRPNIFLSYYIHNKIFSNSEWEKYIDYSLNHLWMDWGGLSSLSKFDKNFIKNHNGDNFFQNKGKSLHNGDSWIFLNNIAAIALNRLNPNKYKKYVDLILRSDLIIFKQIGTLNEVSSASHLSFSGALSQLWSIATFIELIKELKIDNLDILL